MILLSGRTEVYVERGSVMSTKIATIVRLPKDLLKTLKCRAFEEKKSVNQLVCEAIEMSLAAAPQPEEHQRDPFEDVIGIARSGIKDASSKHDRYPYGRKKPSCT
jgi:hypothetical protein